MWKSFLSYREYQQVKKTLSNYSNVPNKIEDTEGYHTLDFRRKNKGKHVVSTYSRQNAWPCKKTISIDKQIIF